jgi:hypothetical protein
MKRALAQKQVKLSVFDGVRVQTRLFPQAFDEKGNPASSSRTRSKNFVAMIPSFPVIRGHSLLKSGLQQFRLGSDAGQKTGQCR